MQVLLLLALTFLTANADLYIQNLRGSNNRLDEANRERNNANRMFDSQNNDRGGYNVGKLNVYESEEVPLSITLQHGCGTKDVKHCDVIVQALCDPMARDGTTTQRIPENPANCRNFNCDTDVKFGRHESYEFYQTCKSTERNQGLFQASQQPNRGDATRTRQNPGGTRRGYECPEERDYYPYWNPSPWIDIALYTKDTGKCAMYLQNSQNTLGRYFCSIPDELKAELNLGIGDTPITEAACNALQGAGANGANATSATWAYMPPNGYPAPECFESLPSRPNHLGLNGGDTQWTYNWKVPSEMVRPGEEETSCVIRVRYNISEDYAGTMQAGVPLDQFPSGEVPGANTNNAAFISNQVSVDSSFNRKPNGGGNANNRPSKLRLWARYGLTDAQNGYDATDDTMQDANDGNNGQGLGDNRDYRLRNNPKVDALGATYGDGNFRLRLQLAVNTAQFGRTFQDRTHVMYFKKRPADAGNANIKMVSVAGKRGNIVQTFPGTEYFFFPETLHVRKFDLVHFSWSGSDTNPNNNDGQGKQGTDRHNACPMKNSNYAGDTDPSAYTQNGIGLGKVDAIGSLGGNYPAFVKEPEGYAKAESLSPCSTPEMVQTPMAGFPLDALASLCTLRRQGDASDDYGNMEELDDAGTSFNMVPIQATETGCWSYVSTRNNNFSNRSQKGTLCVDAGDYGKGQAGPDGGWVTSDSATIQIPQGSITGITTLEISSTPSDANNVVSDTFWIEPVEIETLVTNENNEKAWLMFTMPYSNRALSMQQVQHMNANGDWIEVGNSRLDTETDAQGNEITVAKLAINEGGAYRVVDTPNAGAIIAIVLAGIVFLMTCGFLIYYRNYRMNKEPAEDFNAVIN